jgi:hypothetical protein
MDMGLLLPLAVVNNTAVSMGVQVAVFSSLGVYPQWGFWIGLLLFFQDNFTMQRISWRKSGVLPGCPLGTVATFLQTVSRDWHPACQRIWVPFG